MSARKHGRARRSRWIIAGGIVSAGAGVAGLVGAAPAHAQTGPSASFALGVLTIVGDGADNALVVSRNAAGAILVNGGAIPVRGGNPTVANTRAITMLGQAGNDTLTVDETNGALPQVTLFGGVGNDVITGGSAADLLFGQAGNDTLLGKGGSDRLFGGADNDTLDGGDADDQSFGEAGNDRMVWNPGDDTDLNEGGADIDTVEVNGGNGAEQFTTTANGAHVRFDRVTPAPFSLDIGTSEKLIVNANGGDDRFSAAGNLAALIEITVDGGTGADNILGSNGVDFLLGGDGVDFVDGQQGNDVALMGAGDDTFQWDPGDGNDVIEGQAGTDTMQFNGSNANEIMDVSANGGRVRFSRNIAAVVMDLNDVETVNVTAVSGADTVTVNDLSGTDVTHINADLAATPGSHVPDAEADNVIVNATNGDDVVVLAGQNDTLQVRGVPADIDVSGAQVVTDRITVSALNGGDVVDASGMTAGSASLTIDGGNNDDVLIGGDGDDVIRGGDGDDVLLGGPGINVLDGGAGDNILIDGENLVGGQATARTWLQDHTRTVAGRTVLDRNGKSYTVPVASLTAPGAETTA